jgi:hypothetical protein
MREWTTGSFCFYEFWNFCQVSSRSGYHENFYFMSRFLRVVGVS